MSYSYSGDYTAKSFSFPSSAIHEDSDREKIEGGGEFNFMEKAIWKRIGIWSIGYYVSTIGLNERAIKAYVKHQWKEDIGQLKLELGG